MIRAGMIEDWEAACRIMPMTQKEDARGVASVDPETGELWGLVVCEDWTVTSVCVHIVLAKPIRAIRDKLFENVADFVYNQAGRVKMIGMVPGDNDAALSMNGKIGFRELFRIEEGYDWGIDYVIMECLREDCRYWTPREPLKQAVGEN